MNNIYFIDICTLFEQYYTGISNVNFQIVKYFTYKDSSNIYFFHLDKIVKEEIVYKILANKHGGKWLLDLHHNTNMYCTTINEVKNKNKNKKSIGIYSNVKLIHDMFDYEIQIIYDLTFLITPELHHSDTVNFHAKCIESDIKDNDINVCISESTKDDLVTYLGVSENKCLVSLLAADNSALSDHLYTNLLEKYTVEDFILVLGTVEPRKNINMILQYLEKDSSILYKYKIVFLGRDGWGRSFNDLISELKIDNNLKLNIKHFGYVSDEEKNILIMSSRLLIYPSVYEGFGLPVLEALSFGCPVLTTFSSSIPEVGQNYVNYFDPYSLESFSSSIEKSLTEDINKKKLINFSKNFSWNNFCKTIEKRIDMMIKEKNYAIKR